MTNYKGNLNCYENMEELKFGSNMLSSNNYKDNMLTNTNSDISICDI